MKDITSTTFGLLIAFFLPGLACFYGLGSWSIAIKNMFDTFLTAQSNIGLFFLVFAGAVIISLELTLLRWILFELLLCKSIKFDPNDFHELGKDEKKLAAFRAVAEEHYRYHQFWGGMFFAIPVFYIGWLLQIWLTLGCLYKVSLIVALVLIEFITACGALKAFKNYITRGKQILKGE